MMDILMESLTRRKEPVALLPRSYLFVPGRDAHRIGKALESAADAVVIDLEDAVAQEEKEAARRVVKEAMREKGSRPHVYVRINGLHSPFWQADCECAQEAGFAGIMVPKVGSAEDIVRLKRELTAEMTIIPLIETARGVHFAYEIALADAAVTRLAFGAVDYSLDLGIALTDEQLELVYPRSRLAVASRAAGIDPPIDTVFTDLNHEKGLIRETRMAKRLGFRGKLLIHPKQIQPVHTVFSPTKDELAWAQAVVEAFQAAEKQGVAAISVDGKMVDYPVYKHALTILAWQK